MIFKPALARAVANGRKTQTRRPVKADKPCRYKVGHDYAVQPGRGKSAIARIKVLSVREEAVGAITHADAKAEGFRNAAAFKAYWVQLYDAKYLADYMEVNSLDALSEPFLLDRFNARHAYKLVSVIAFELMQDTPRFLAPSGRGTVMHVDRGVVGNPESVVTDYVTSPGMAIDDVECVGEEWLARFSKDANEFCIGRQIKKGQARQEQRNSRRDRLFKAA